LFELPQALASDEDLTLVTDNGPGVAFTAVFVTWRSGLGNRSDQRRQA
jgi:hypothetical protein